MAIKIYPNPALDQFTLSIEIKNNEDLTLKIYDVIGKLISTEKIHQNDQKINVDKLNNGVYWIEVQSSNWTEKQQLLIQR